MLDNGKYEATLSALERLLDQQEETRAQRLQDEEKGSRALTKAQVASKRGGGGNGDGIGIFSCVLNWDGC